MNGKIGACAYQHYLSQETTREEEVQAFATLAHTQSEYDLTGFVTMSAQACLVVCAKVGINLGADGSSHPFVGAGLGGGEEDGASFSGSEQYVNDSPESGLGSTVECSIGSLQTSINNRGGGGIGQSTYSSGECSATVDYAF
jgi:hypothetical protein